MRIIAGKFKGRSINFIKFLTTRPLKDSVRENIFNVINHSNKFNIRIEESNVLDLYSGIGSFGLECLSRGAKKVTFVEKNFSVLKILRKNLNSLSVNEKANIINGEIENNIDLLVKEKFNIFFFDPPFVDRKFIKNLKNLKKANIHESDHIVVIHREKNSVDELDKSIQNQIIKYYGRSKIIFGTFV
tara:strand:+ start:4394 stop:4954 length:561 start_codon:yes stop_codon:yes gene_type:complete